MNWRMSCITESILVLSTFVFSYSVIADSCWDHNGSVMRLVAANNQRWFYYENPKAVLREAGVAPGTLLFDGRKQGNSYIGTARRFSKYCPDKPLQYSVDGPVSRNQRQVTLRGSRPAFARCIIDQRYADDTLVFTYLRECSPPSMGSPGVIDENSTLRSTKNHSPTDTSKLTIRWESATWTIKSSQYLGNKVLKCGNLDATMIVTASPAFHARLAFTDVYYFHTIGEIEGRELLDRRGEAMFVSDHQPLTIQARRFTCTTSWGKPVMVAELNFIDAQDTTHHLESETTFEER